MIARSIHTALTASGSVLAVGGLSAVAALSLPGLDPLSRGILDGVLLAIWTAYALQLAIGWGILDLYSGGNARFALFVDLAAVIVPVLALGLMGRGRDASLFCAVWTLKPLRELAAFRLVLRVLSNEARNLFGVLALFATILFLASLGAYVFERTDQPDAFGSIPQAMWWAVVTLTTTGYGDEITQSFAGRVLAGAVMMCGIGLFALWAGILASGFADELRRRDFSVVWQLVAGVPLFAGIPHRDLAEIVRALKPRRAAAGAVLVRKGEPGTEMFFILDGKVRVATSPPAELGPGEYFGEMAIISGAPRGATVTAATPVSLLILHLSDFQLLIERDPALADNIRRTAEARRPVPKPETDRPA